MEDSIRINTIRKAKLEGLINALTEEDTTQAEHGDNHSVDKVIMILPLILIMQVHRMIMHLQEMKLIKILMTSALMVALVLLVLEDCISFVLFALLILIYDC